jgi:hypothetical protein
MSDETCPSRLEKTAARRLRRIPIMGAQIASQIQVISCSLDVFQFEEFFKSSGFQMQSLYEHRITITTSLNLSSLPNAPPVFSTIERITRHARAFGKFFRRMQQLETRRFVLLPICTDVVLYYWSKVVQSTEVSPELINGTPLRANPSSFLFC